MLRYSSFKNISRVGVTKRLVSTISRFPEEQLFSSKGHSFDFDVYKPSHSFLPKSLNNPDEPVIFIHDFLSNKSANKVEVNDISKTLETNVYTANLRNHFSRMKQIEFAKPFDINTLLDDLVEFYKELGFEKVMLIGEGLGGKIAMLASLLRSKDMNIEKLVVIESLPQDLTATASAELESWVKGLAFLLNDSKITKFDREYLEKCYEILSTKYGIKDNRTLGYLLSNITNQRVNSKELNKYQYLESRVPVNHIIESSFLEDYEKWPMSEIKESKFDKPTLFLMGRNSTYYPKALNETLKMNSNISKYFPKSTLKTFTSDHWLLHTQSAHATNAICQFLLYEHNPMYDKLRNFEEQE
ncbi:hypothetical protein DASC09_016150 [Saccharomycopsis crataegensis]|uniref:Uncharacterized protein n=1 Tax=Saccharomycopsis crataegensis TaxID=43959 RepID=A0AAV5QIH6_9ASCO|nr:hypothetical protein DASC09_016150 [Saccharomycopsis crataegensis]